MKKTIQAAAGKIRVIDEREFEPENKDDGKKAEEIGLLGAKHFVENPFHPSVD